MENGEVVNNYLLFVSSRIRQRRASIRYCVLATKKCLPTTWIPRIWTIQTCLTAKHIAKRIVSHRRYMVWNFACRVRFTRFIYQQFKGSARTGESDPAGLHWTFLRGKSNRREILRACRTNELRENSPPWRSDRVFSSSLWLCVKRGRTRCNERCVRRVKRIF